MRIYIFLLLFLSFFSLDAQWSGPKTEIETRIAVGRGDNLPFWLLSNRYGILTNNSNQIFGRISHSNSYVKGDLSVAYGSSLVGRPGNEAAVYFEEWYTEIKYHFIKFEAGARRKEFEVTNTGLSSGDILWSGNARPMPDITLSTVDFVEIPFTSGYLKLNSGMSHGWMDDYPGIKNVLLHHKWLIFKAGGEKGIHVTGGLHHYAQWGGISKRYGELPKNFKTFSKVFIANGGNEDSPLNEIINAAGNHIGSYNLSVDYRFKNFEIGLSWESIFEDNSGRKLRNYPDGLYGIVIKQNNPEALVRQLQIEYLNTTNQSGPLVVDSINNIPPTGGDNYFSHSIYRMGWTSHLMTIGTPLITSPVYNSDNTLGAINNNRVQAIHFGIEGGKGNLDYRLLYTHSLNRGTYNKEFVSNDNFYCLSLKFKNVIINQSTLLIDIGLDSGKFYGNNFGILFGWNQKFGKF